MSRQSCDSRSGGGRRWVSDTSADGGGGCSSTFVPPLFLGDMAICAVAPPMAWQPCSSTWSMWVVCRWASSSNSGASASAGSEIRTVAEEGCRAEGRSVSTERDGRR